MIKKLSLILCLILLLGCVPIESIESIPTPAQAAPTVQPFKIPEWAFGDWVGYAHDSSENKFMSYLSMDNERITFCGYDWDIESEDNNILNLTLSYKNNMEAHRDFQIAGDVTLTVFEPTPDDYQYNPLKRKLLGGIRDSTGKSIATFALYWMESSLSFEPYWYGEYQNMTGTIKGVYVYDSESTAYINEDGQLDAENAFRYGGIVYEDEAGVVRIKSTYIIEGGKTIIEPRYQNSQYLLVNNWIEMGIEGDNAAPLALFADIDTKTGQFNYGIPPESSSYYRDVYLPQLKTNIDEYRKNDNLETLDSVHNALRYVATQLAQNKIDVTSLNDIGTFIRTADQNGEISFHKGKLANIQYGDTLTDIKKQYDLQPLTIDPNKYYLSAGSDVHFYTDQKGLILATYGQDEHVCYVYVDKPGYKTQEGYQVGDIMLLDSNDYNANYFVMDGWIRYQRQ